VRSGRPIWPFITLGALVAVIAVVAVVLLTGGDDADKAASDAQTVSFEKPTDPGEDPFTKPADVRGGDKVDVGSGPFGGSGSDLVCDRELLIRSLRARPDRMKEWARVLDVEPDIHSVARYIRTLRSVTLTRDTRVTNHTFVDGRAVPLQSILQAGTAVLVDEKGVPVARCRCGNPLLEPVYVKTAKCIGCPAHYTPPPPCDYFDFGREYSDYDGDEYLRVYRRRDFAHSCYLPYPDPPRTRTGQRARGRPTTTSPAASISPSSGTAADTYTLRASGFRPNVMLSVSLTRPDGGSESYSIRTDGSGSGSYTFPHVADAVTGTYTAAVTDPGSSDRATATASVAAAQQAEPDQSQDQGGGGLQCDPPRSQLESEQCAERNSPQTPDSNYDCPDQPPAHPGEDYLRNCPNQP
jgi:hypothetical protein